MCLERQRQVQVLVVSLAACASPAHVPGPGPCLSLRGLWHLSPTLADLCADPQLAQCQARGARVPATRCGLQARINRRVGDSRRLHGGDLNPVGKQKARSLDNHAACLKCKHIFYTDVKAKPNSHPHRETVVYNPELSLTGYLSRYHMREIAHVEVTLHLPQSKKHRYLIYPASLCGLRKFHTSCLLFLSGIKPHSSPNDPTPPAQFEAGSGCSSNCRRTLRIARENKNATAACQLISSAKGKTFAQQNFSIVIQPQGL